jgi:hypothetical protein
MKDEKRGGRGRETPRLFWPCSKSTIVSYRPTQTLGTLGGMTGSVNDCDRDDMGGSHLITL